MRNTLKIEQRSEARRKDDLFVGTIKKYQHLTEHDVPALAMALGMSRATVYSRLRRPEGFTLRELRLLRKTLGIPSEELNGIL